MAEVTATFLSCDIRLTDGSKEEFIEFEETDLTPDDFYFLKELPITSSIDLYAYFSARKSIDRFKNKDEVRIIPVLFLFSDDEISFTELLEKSNNILREIDCKDGVISDFISKLKDINPEEFESNGGDLIDCVMDLISEIIGTRLFDGNFWVPSDPIPASKIRCLSIHSVDYCQKGDDECYIYRRADEFEADSETPPKTPHFKYLLAKWTDIQAKEAPNGRPWNSYNICDVVCALEKGDIDLLVPEEWWPNKKDEELLINNMNLRNVMIPNSAEIIGNDTFASSDLESVDISDGIKLIGNKAFYGNRNLKSVRLPKSLEVIGEYAFDECNSGLVLNIPESVRKIGFTTRPDLLKFAIEHNIYISADCLTIYRAFKELMQKSDAETVRLLINALKMPYDFMECWHVGVMHDAIEFGTAEQTAILLDSKKLKFTDDELFYFIDYASEIGKPEHTGYLLNYYSMSRHGQIDFSYLSCDIVLTDWSSVEFIPLKNNGFEPSDFYFLKDLPITSSIDLYAYFSARDSIDCFKNKDEVRIIPVLFLFSNDKISFAELLETSNSILQEIDCKDGIISDFVSRLKDINPEEFDSNDDLIHVVMDLISKIIGAQLFDEDFIEFPANPIPASKIQYLSIHFEDFCKRRYVEVELNNYWDGERYHRSEDEFEADSKTLPEFPDLDECPHFKYLMAKWTDIQAEVAPGVASSKRSHDDNVEWALAEGDIELLVPEWWFSNIDEDVPINDWEYSDSKKIISDDTFASSDLESVDIPDGVKEIRDYAFCHKRYLKSVHLPENLEKIGNYAFDKCNREIGFTTRPDLLKFAIEHDIHISADSLTIYRTFKELMKESDAERVRLLINDLRFPHDFMDFWHVGVMHNAIEFGTAEQTAALLNSGKLEFTDDELEYLIDYAAECGKPEHTACLLNYKNEKDRQEEEE